MRVGEIVVTPLSDGMVHLPPGYFGGVDWQQHADLLGPQTGTIDLPIGCFLIQTGGRTILVDAGLGPRRLDWGEGGALPEALRSAGVSPAEIDTVVCTHLHIDHCGWLVADGRPFFPRASVRFGAGDWDLAMGLPAGSPTRDAMELLAAAGRLDPIEEDRTPLAPGITSAATPGHTPGHLSLILASGEERAILLGDMVTSPRQLEEPEWQNMTDVDPVLAARTRASMWREIEGTNQVATAAHFPGLEFGRIIRTARAHRFVVLSGEVGA